LSSWQTLSASVALGSLDRQAMGAASSNTGGEPESAEVLESAWQDHFKAAVLTETFNECLKKQRPLAFPGAVPSIGGLAEVDTILSALVKGSDTGNSGAYKNGEPHMRGNNIFLAYLDQASLTLSDAERFIPQLLSLCTSLSPTFHYVSSRIVIDPPGVQRSSLQADSDLLAIQIWGEQRLSVSQPIAGLPVTAKRPEPLLMPTLCPGDAIFVPQGMEVRFLESADPRSPTMYAALSLRSNEQSLAVSIGKHLSDALRSGNLSEETDNFLRTAVTKQTVPRRLAGASGDGSEAAAAKIANLEVGLKAAVAELSKQINAKSLREHVAKRMDELRTEQAEGAARIALRKLPDPDGQVFNTSYIRVAREVSCSCTPGDSRALFTRSSETLALPISPSASYLISELCDGKPRLVSSLTCSDPLERLCVCQILIFKKCFDIHLEEGGSGN